MPWSFLQLITFGLLLLHFASVVEAGKFANKCKSLLCFGRDDDAGGSPRDHKGVDCPNPKAPRNAKGWGIAKHKTFPTVEQIMADYKLCGICSDPNARHLFYSFGGGTTAATKFKNENKELNLKVMADCMPQSFVQAGNLLPGMEKPNGAAQSLWIARNSQAFAKLASGDVYVITNGKGSEAEKATIYTSPYFNQIHPWMGQHNVWYDYEFGALQRNHQVTAIYTVQNHHNPLVADKHGNGAWVRNPAHGENAAHYVDANRVTMATIQAKMDIWNKLPDKDKAAKLADRTCNPGGPQKRATKGKGKGKGKGAADVGASCPLPAKKQPKKPTPTTMRKVVGKPTPKPHATKPKTTKPKTTKPKPKATKPKPKATKPKPKATRPKKTKPKKKGKKGGK
jgi:hypothetical protein